MSENRVLLLEGSVRLTRDTSRLCLSRDGKSDVFVAPSDIAVLIIDSPAVLVSSAALRLLSKSGAVVLLTDESHMPLGSLLPATGRARQVSRLTRQIDAQDSDRLNDCWLQIVRCRLHTQAGVLRTLKRKGALNLQRLADKVQPGDPTNCEAQGAKHYWSHLFGKDFRRVKPGAEDQINARLNYGYAVLRSLVARSLVAAGLNTALGIKHCSEKNPFNLADDFVEAFRWVVELQVCEALEEADEPSFDAAARCRLAECVTRNVDMAGGVYRLPSAVETTVSSYCRQIETLSDHMTLDLPLGCAR